MLLLKEVKQMVHRVVPENIVQEVYSIIRRKNLKLWGKQKNQRNFLNRLLYVTLFKDTQGCGYAELKNRIKDIPISVGTLQRNIQIMRDELEQWALTKIDVGDEFAWERSMKNFKRGKFVKNVNLFIDSTDFRLKGKRSTSTSHQSWSFKKNGPAQRYMCVFNGKSRVIHISRGYSPKIYDGEYLKIMRDTLEDKLNGGCVCGDTHFEEGKKIFKNVEFVTTISKPRGRKKRARKDQENTPVKLTKEQETINSQIRSIRGNVESPFGLISNRFKSLEVWNEGEQQQDSLVLFAMVLMGLKEN